MRYDRPIPGRISYRLREHDYTAPGSFFVTICAAQGHCLFGQVVDGIMHRNTIGDIVHDEWLRTASIRGNLDLDEFVVMPNHFHGIIHIVGPGSGRPEPGGATRRVAHQNDDASTGATRRVAYQNDDTPTGATRRVAPPYGRQPNGPPSGSLGAIIGQIKSQATKRINAIRETPGQPVWQSRYHERIIRTETSLHRIRAYIRNNPMQWYLDKHNPLRRP